MKRPASHVAASRRLKERGNHDRNAFERGNRLAAADQQEQAIAAFSECLQHNPQDWQALFNRGTAHMRLKQYPQALEDYLAAAALNPSSSNIKCNLAVLLKELGELTLAENLLLEVLQAEPQHAEAWSNLGVVCNTRCVTTMR
jgi:tetratricopeptide (TPR) repeat protein